MAIQKKTEGRDLDEYLQEVWDSLESAWDKSKFDMKQGYDSEYECDCITITSKDNEGVLAKIYVNDYEGKHPVGFDVVYHYPGDKGVGVMGSYEFQSTDMDGLGEEVFDYFDEIKKKAAGASFESDLQAYADAVKADKYDKQSVIDDGWEFYNSVEYDEDIVRDDFKQKYDGKTYLLHITFNPSTKDVSDVKWDISAIESKKKESLYGRPDSEKDELAGKYYVDIENDSEGTIYSSKQEFNDYASAEEWANSELEKNADDEDVFQASIYKMFVDTDTDQLDSDLEGTILKSDVCESKKSEADATFKVGDFVNYDAESDGKDVYDSFIPCEVVDVKDDGTLGLCVYGSYENEEGLGENASASCCSKLDHYAGMVDANTYYTDGKYKAYKGGWEILITDKELDPKVYEFIGTMDDLSEVVDFDDYYGGENFVYDEDLRDDLGATGVDTDGVDFADMSGDLAKASDSPEESKKSEAKKIVDNGFVSFRETKHPRELRKLYKACQDRFGVSDYVSYMKEDISRDGADCQYKIKGLTEDDKPIVIEMNYYGDSGDYNYEIDVSLLETEGGSSLDTIGKGAPSHNFDAALNSAMASVDKYLQGLPTRNDESKKSEGLPPKKLGDRRYHSRADLINKMKQVGATEITTRDQYDELRSKQWLHKGGYAMDINGNLVGQTYFGDKDGKWYYATTKTFQGDYLPECKEESKKSEAEGSLAELIDKVDNMFHYHNKNLNNYQYNTIDDLLEALKSKDTDKIKEAIRNLDNLVHYRNKNLNKSQYYLLDELLEALQKKYKKSEEAKKSESLTLKQKELKDMARFGQAEDITTISDEEAKALRKKGIETIGISRGTYGMNGALLRDNEGKKYVITARSSNLFYFV